MKTPHTIQKPDYWRQRAKVAEARVKRLEDEFVGHSRRLQDVLLQEAKTFINAAATEISMLRKALELARAEAEADREDIP